MFLVDHVVTSSLNMLLLCIYRAVFLQEYESYMARAYRQQSNPKIGGSTDSSGSTLSMAGFLVLCAWTVSTIVVLH